MTLRTLVGSLALIAGFGQTAASVITPADFGSAAQVQTFDSLPVGGSADPLVLNGVTYSFSPGGHYILAANPVNYVCISGNCLSNAGSGASWFITLSTPVDRVGGYLTGISDSLTLPGTDVTYYDVNNVRIGGTFHPISLNGTASSPSFFGFESAANEIKFIRIKTDASFGMTLDNFTTEVLAPVPEPSTWAMMIIGFIGVGLIANRRRKRLRVNSSAPDAFGNHTGHPFLCP
jgi:hypothetical protein